MQQTTFSLLLVIAMPCLAACHGVLSEVPTEDTTPPVHVRSTGDDAGPAVDAAQRDDAATTEDPAIHEDAAINEDAGLPPMGVDAASPGDSGAQIDAGASAPVDAGGPSDASGPSDAGSSGACVPAHQLWSDDFETGDYSRWTSSGYGGAWGNGCQSNGISTARAHGGTRSQRSEITCTYPESHRGYGGLQFSGDRVVPSYTNTGTGIDAPHGVVNTFHSWVETPYAFGGGRWLSLWTVNTDCAWGEQVITLGFEDASGRLTPAHIVSTGGTVTYEPGAPAFPRGEWVRTTVYVNLHTGQLHVWQNGQSLLHATVSRPSNDLCQFHWGAYAAGSNDDIVLYEDDNALFKLDAPWTDFSREPWLGGDVQICE